MEIRLESLRDRPRRLTFAEPAEAFPALCELASRGEAVFRGTVEIDLVAALVGSLVEVEGTLACAVELPCSRCLVPAEQRLQLSVALSFSRRAHVDAEVADERELTADEVGLIPFDGDEIDLRPALEQELLMALPQHPLCREECAGLCQVCGADLNQRRCACDPPVFHAGLAALRNFKLRGGDAD